MSKKIWMIQKPIQWKKHGCWYTNVKDPDTKDIIMERTDATEHQSYQTVIEWARLENKIREESEALENAKPDNVGSSLAEDCSGNSTTIQGS